jgi:hypothetical protein
MKPSPALKVCHRVFLLIYSRHNVNLERTGVPAAAVVTSAPGIFQHLRQNSRDSLSLFHDSAPRVEHAVFFVSVGGNSQFKMKVPVHGVV